MKSAIAIEPFSESSTRQAYCLGHFAFVFALIVAGLDQLFHLLVNWDNYVTQVVDRLVSRQGHELPLIVGACILAAWLLLTILNLVAVSGHLDALLCLGLPLAAFALYRLSTFSTNSHRRQLLPENT